VRQSHIIKVLITGPAVRAKPFEFRL